jgi:hypothetical protein
MRIRVIITLVILNLTVAGCFGGAPKQRFLRIQDPGVKSCEELPNKSEIAADYVIAVKNIDSLPSLNRTSVLMGSGNVFTPSHSWYWEGTPAETLTMVVVDHISFSDRFTSVWPYRPRVERDALLTGRVTTFAAELGDPARFQLEVRMELWNERGSRKLAAKTFDVARELPGYGPEAAGDPDVLAEAAANAVCIFGNEVRAWLEDKEDLIRNP